MSAYFAATSTIDEKLYAHIIIVGESENIVSRLKSYPGLVFLNYCPTKKQAQKVIDAWNQSYRDNGTCAF